MVSQPDARAQRDMIDLLLAHGADANIRWCGDDDHPRCDDRNGVIPAACTPRFWATRIAHGSIQHGADSSFRDWRGLTAEDYWGVKTTTASWCSRLRVDEPLVNDGRWLFDGKLFDGNAEILTALKESPDLSIEVVKDKRICERAAVAYARRRMTEPTQTTPRPILPVLVVRVGGVWLVDNTTQSCQRVGDGCLQPSLASAWLGYDWIVTFAQPRAFERVPSFVVSGYLLPLASAARDALSMFRIA